MTTWIIEPRDPLIVRDGRPFNFQPGVLAHTLPFPFPSTTAGAARNRAGKNTEGVFNVPKTDLNTLRAIKVRGPLLAELGTEGEVHPLVPAPGDALLLESTSDRVQCKRMLPVNLPTGAQTEMPTDPPQERHIAGDQAVNGAAQKQGRELLLVGTEDIETKKPAKGQPAFWHWNVFERWLLTPDQMHKQTFERSELGIQALSQDQRVHIALERRMMVASEGALFETHSLEFTQTVQSGTLQHARRLTLLLDVDDEQNNQYKVTEGLDCLGSERRMVTWSKSERKLPDWPPGLVEQIVAEQHCRLILLTPACFTKGSVPTHLQQTQKGVTPELQAVLVNRPSVISGWDMEQWRPKPTRRLVPAGSIFFLKLQGSPAAIEKWVKDIWMSCIGDDEQDCNDGFGLAVLGTWDGKPVEMSIQKRRSSHEKNAAPN